MEGVSDLEGSCDNCSVKYVAARALIKSRRSTVGRCGDKKDDDDDEPNDEPNDETADVKDGTNKLLLLLLLPLLLLPARVPSDDDTRRCSSLAAS